MQVAEDRGERRDGTTAGPRVSGRPWRAPVVVGAVAAVGTVAIAALDPSDGGAPVCLSQSILGVDCPLCGGLRCVNSLVRGDLLAAADHNVLLAVVLPVAAVLWAAWMVRAVQGRPLRLPRPPRWSLVALGVVLVTFTVTRNIGGGGWIGWLGSSAGPP
jgi:hypothetical protein